MNIKTFDLKFITPCFCSGADQKTAEIRSASIRGELRWWFRALGCTADEESHVFGGVAGRGGRKSKIMVRVSSQRYTSDPSVLPRVDGIDPISYMLYFASVSGGRNGRMQSGAFIAPGSHFSLHIGISDKLNKDMESKLMRCLNLFFAFGSIGLRATRGSGAFGFCEINNRKSATQFQSFTNGISGLDTAVVCTSNGDPIWIEEDKWKLVYKVFGTILKEGYRQNCFKGRKWLSAGNNGTNPTPLGSAKPRQKSGLRFRPVLLRDGILPILIYTDRFLGAESRKLDFDMVTSCASGLEYTVKRIKDVVLTGS